jgi:23S rRNA pseudouridine2605 synthase
MESTERLNKYLALHMGLSRRAADELIEKNKVTINGEPAPLGARVAEDDAVVVNGKPVSATTEYQYLALNKPVGYVSSRKRQGRSPTIYELIPHEYHDLKPVGRLDRESSGLILLTNDGDFAFHMTHPQFVKVKIYKVMLNRELEPLHQQMISDYGVTLNDGPSKLDLMRLSDDNRKEWQVTMSEGRNRQIRRTFDALGYTVTKLHRTDFGPYALHGIKPGKFEVVEKSNSCTQDAAYAR